MAPDTSTADLADFLLANASLIARLHDQAGAARWGVSLDDFGEALWRSALRRFGASPPGGDALAKYLGALHLADLALACALRRGSESAWAEFVASYRPVLYAAARAIVGSAGEARARELADSLYAELYGLARRPLLDYFHGRSKLSTWLRTVLAQRHVDALRVTQRIDSLDGDSPLPPRAAARPARGSADADPDRSRLLPRLRQCVIAAVAAACAADRLLLSLYYVKEMTLAEIARVQGVHEATTSRQLDRIRRELRKQIEYSLASGHAAENGTAAQPGLSPKQVELCFSYALEDWSFDLGGALSGITAPEREI